MTENDKGKKTSTPLQSGIPRLSALMVGNLAKMLFWSFEQVTAVGNDSSSHAFLCLQIAVKVYQKCLGGCWVSEGWLVLRQHSPEMRPFLNVLGGTPKITPCFRKVLLIRTASTTLATECP